MHSDRQHQKGIEELYGEEAEGIKDSIHNRDKGKGLCRACQKPGHFARNCPMRKTTVSKPALMSHSGKQASSQLKEAFPFCKKQGQDELTRCQRQPSAYINHKSRGKPRNPAKGNSNQSSCLESAVLTIIREGMDSYDQPPTEGEIETQDGEGMNTMFLIQEVTVQGDSVTLRARTFYDKGSNVTIIWYALAERLRLKQKLIRLGRDMMDWDTRTHYIHLKPRKGRRLYCWQWESRRSLRR